MLHKSSRLSCPYISRCWMNCNLVLHPIKSMVIRKVNIIVQASKHYMRFMNDKYLWGLSRFWWYIISKRRPFKKFTKHWLNVLLASIFLVDSSSYQNLAFQQKHSNLALFKLSKVNCSLHQCGLQFLAALSSWYKFQDKHSFCWCASKCKVWMFPL